mgnify:CR=1 FL=1
MKLPTSVYYSSKLQVKTMKLIYSPNQLALISSSSIACPFLAGNYINYINYNNSHHASQLLDMRECDIITYIVSPISARAYIYIQRLLTMSSIIDLHASPSSHCQLTRAFTLSICQLIRDTHCLYVNSFVTPTVYN